jgi:hypothetical protein
MEKQSLNYLNFDYATIIKKLRYSYDPKLMLEELIRAGFLFITEDIVEIIDKDIKERDSEMNQLKNLNPGLTEEDINSNHKSIISRLNLLRKLFMDRAYETVFQKLKTIRIKEKETWEFIKKMRYSFAHTTDFIDFQSKIYDLEEGYPQSHRIDSIFNGINSYHSWALRDLAEYEANQKSGHLKKEKITYKAIAIACFFLGIDISSANAKECLSMFEFSGKKSERYLIRQKVIKTDKLTKITGVKKTDTMHLDAFKGAKRCINSVNDKDLAISANKSLTNIETTYKTNYKNKYD